MDCQIMPEEFKKEGGSSAAVLVQIVAQESIWLAKER